MYHGREWKLICQGLEIMRWLGVRLWLPSCGPSAALMWIRNSFCEQKVLKRARKTRQCRRNQRTRHRIQSLVQHYPIIEERDSRVNVWASERANLRSVRNQADENSIAYQRTARVPNREIIRSVKPQIAAKWKLPGAGTSFEKTSLCADLRLIHWTFLAAFFIG